MAVQSQMMSVQIRDGRLRAAPSFLGKVIGPVAYGDRVTVLEEKRAWRRVSAPGGVQGWIHQSALTTKKIVLRAGAADVDTGATTDELALAGKGFNQQVENQYRSQRPDLNFAWLDRMAEYRVSPAEMAAFLREGELRAEGGGQ